jgi:hypothetical protein
MFIHLVSLLVEFSPEALIENSPVRPDGAVHQWRKVPPRELSMALVADVQRDSEIGRCATREVGGGVGCRER